MRNDAVLPPPDVPIQRASFAWSGLARIQGLLIVLLVTTVFLGVQVYTDEAFWQTLALLWVVVGAGLWMIGRLSRSLDDPSLRKLQWVYALKVLLVLVVLYAGWVPMLNPDSATFGYDPQRYFFQAHDFAVSGLDPTELPGLNYAGILYYYGVIFALLGFNPAVPALVNVLVTLVATLLLIRVGYEIRPQRTRWDWTLGLAMVMPEVIWYDALTARETLVMSLLVICILSAAMYFVRRPGSAFGLLQAFWALPALLLIGIVRTSVLAPAVASIALLFVTARMSPKRRLAGFVLIGAAAGLLLLSPILSSALGSTRFDVMHLLSFISQSDENYLANITWSDQSLGQLLIPSGPVEAILFLPIRLVFYIVSPLPNINVTISGLADGDWRDWQSLFTSASSLLNLLLIPVAVGAFIEALRSRDRRAELAFHIPLWITLVAIAGGNQIIHERYRVMAVPLLWGCIWLGRTCSRRLLRTAYLSWGALLGVGGFAYLAYKFVL